MLTPEDKIAILAQAGFHSESHEAQIVLLSVRMSRLEAHCRLNPGDWDARQGAALLARQRRDLLMQLALGHGQRFQTLVRGIRLPAQEQEAIGELVEAKLEERAMRRDAGVKVIYQSDLR